MSQMKYRVLLLGSHPTQYSSPVFRRLARDTRLEIQVAYCSLHGAKAGYDPGFEREIVWDIPLLDGYIWNELPNRASRPGLERFWGLVNPAVWKLIRQGNFDAVVIYTGYLYATFWIAVAAAKMSRTAIVFGTDSHTLDSQKARFWKKTAKRIFWPRLFRLADVAIGQSSGGLALLRSLGLPNSRIGLFPYVVDNERWKRAAAQANRAEVRAAWGIPPDAPVVLFSAKLQPWKRPLDLLRAFAKANVKNAHLVFAGDGGMRGEVDAETERLGLTGRVKLLGFVNQTELPSVYRGADVLVLPSRYEAFGVVVNEAMLCGCVPIVSNRVGARFDLIEDGRTGFVYPSGDVERLGEVLRSLLSDPTRIMRMSESAAAKVEEWSPEKYASCFLDVIERARNHRDGIRST
jgi:glycosyltransferase involved in cell wall biosynthesis